MPEPTKLPATEYPAALLAISDLLLEQGREAEANLLREIAGWTETKIPPEISPETLERWRRELNRKVIGRFPRRISRPDPA